MHASCLRFLVLGALAFLFFGLQACTQEGKQPDQPTSESQAQTDIDVWDAKVQSPAQHVSKGGFGLWNAAQEDSVKKAFVAGSRYHRAFGSFYQDSTGRFALLYYTFGIPEGAQDIFSFTPCPFLDSATFRPLTDCYWVDKNGVYCDMSGMTPFGKIFRVSGASQRSFRPIACRTLAVDGRKVFLGGKVLADLSAIGLQVYATADNCYINSSGAIFLVGPQAVYNEFERLPDKTARNFEVPTGYHLVYPASSKQRKGKR